MDKLSDLVRAGRYTFYCPQCDDNTADSSSLPELANQIAALEQRLAEAEATIDRQAAEIEGLRKCKDGIQNTVEKIMQLGEIRDTALRDGGE